MSEQLVPVTDQESIAAALRETGLLLKLKGENAFKAKAYISGARVIERTTLDIPALIESERLTDLPGIGKSLAGYVTEFYTTGETKLLKQLRAVLPPGAAELSLIEGLTLKRITALHKHLNITSLTELEAACRAGSLATLKGFGLKVQNDILQLIEQAGKLQEGIRLTNAMDVAEDVISYLSKRLKTDQIEVAGEIRRWCEEVEKITILAQADKDKIFRAMNEYPRVVSVEVNGEIVVAALPEGIPIELISVKNLSLGLIAYTGTPEHFEKLQSLAKSQGIDLENDRLLKDERDISALSEPKIFAALGLQYIPAEIREGADEIESAQNDDFASMIDIDDIRGMTHCHSTFSDGVNSIEQMARAAQDMGMEYITITDHSPTAHYAGGLDIERLKEQWEEIERVQQQVDIRILKGTECDILADGKLDYPDHILEKFDIIIASIHSRYRQNEEQMTKRVLEGLKNPHFKIWGHPLGRIVLNRDPIPCDVEKVLEAIADSKLAIEINGDPYRLDLPSRWVKVAKRLGLKFVISTDAHSIGNLQNLPFGIHLARRARVEKSDVLNALPMKQFMKAVKVA